MKSEQADPSPRSVLAFHPKPGDLPEHRRNEWLQQLYGAASELLERYPHDFDGRIRDGWWERPAERELIAAICVLRDELDNIEETGHEDVAERARAEISFNRDLPAIAERLATASREARAWRPT